MRFESKEDIEAPLDVVFSEVADFPALERQAFRKGLDVRVEAGSPASGGPFRRWNINFDYRGKRRELVASLVAIDPEHGYRVTGVVGGIESETIVDIVPLSRNRTRLAVTVKIKAQTLTARLVVQTLKVGRSKFNRKFKRRLRKYAQEIEDRHSAAAY